MNRFDYDNRLAYESAKEKWRLFQVDDKITLVAIAALFDSLDYYDLPPRDREIVKRLTDAGYLEMTEQGMLCSL